MKVIERLLPHRPPFLMVKSIVEYIGGDAPTLNAEYPVGPSSPVFSIAEPPFYWPSVYIIEGLGQCCSLLSLIWACERNPTVKALGTESVGAALMNAEEDAEGAYILEQLSEIFESSAPGAASRIGMLASVDVEIIGQVQAGEVLRYSVERTHVLEGMSRFAVQASVDAQMVAHGTIVGAQLEGTS